MSKPKTSKRPIPAAKPTVDLCDFIENPLKPEYDTLRKALLERLANDEHMSEEVRARLRKSCEEAK